MDSMLSELRERGSKRRYFLEIKHVLPLHAMISYCDYENIKPGTNYSWDQDQRKSGDLFLWQYTLSGWGMLNYRKKKYKIEPGSAMFLRILEDHHYYLPKESPGWEFVDIYFHGTEIMRLFSTLQKRSGPVIYYDKDSPCVKMALNICLMAGKDELISQFDNSSMAYSFAMQLIKSKMSLRENDPKKPEFIQKVEDYCEMNFSRPITVDDLAAVSGYSRYHFSRIFASYQRESPAQYLRNMRLRKAAKMLGDTQLIIKEVATECGFMDCSYFCQIFREMYGFSPEIYRKNRYQ